MRTNAIMFLLVGLVMGCTNQFRYTPGTLAPFAQSQVLQVGECRNLSGWNNPRTLGDSSWLDVPVSEAVRNALVAELQAAGFSIGSGQFTVAADVLSVWMRKAWRDFLEGPTGGKITFRVLESPGGLCRV